MSGRDSFQPYPQTRFAFRDRKRTVCECYAVVKREYDRLLRPENTIGNTGVHGTCRQYRTGW